MFHVQLGDRKRTQDALRVASSFFANGLEKFAAGELHEALALFEQALAVNQKYLESTASGNILCYNHIAAVHDRLGNLGTAFAYYERARVGLSSPRIPDNEANFFARRKRNVMLKHVQQKLEKIPRTHEPKVGAGVHHSDVASLIVSMWEAGEVHLHAGRLNEARVSFEQVLVLNKRFKGAGVDGLLDTASTLARLGLVHSQLGDIPRAEAHLGAADALLKQLPGELGSEPAATQKEVLKQLRVANLAVERALSSHHALAHRQRSKLITQRPNDESIAPVVSIESLKLDSLVDRTLSCGSSLGSVTWRKRFARQVGCNDATVQIDATLDAVPLYPSVDGAATEAAVAEVQPNHGPVIHETASPSNPAGMDAAARQLEMASGAADAAAGACRESEVTEIKDEKRAGADSPAGTSKRVGATDCVGTAERDCTASGSSGSTAPRLQRDERARATVQGSNPKDFSESNRVITAPTHAGMAAAEDEDKDEFAWRKGQEPDDVHGEIDDRVEGAIEQINMCRDAMNQAQIGLDGTTSKLVAQERHLQHELAKLEAEFGPFLKRLADYEEQKLLTSSAAARVAEAERSSAATAQERAERRNRAASKQTESLKMAMELQVVFDRLVPYFVCRTLLEQQLEGGRQAVAASKQQVQTARRAYNCAMDQLETLSLDIQRKQAGRARAGAETGESKVGA